MSQYLLLLYDDPAAVNEFKKLSPPEMQKAIQQYVDWTNKAQKSGFWVASNKLVDDAGRVLRGARSGKPRVTDGPFAEAKELLGGYYIIEASTYDEAVQRTSDHPHLAHGTIALRQIESLR